MTKKLPLASRATFRRVRLEEPIISASSSAINNGVIVPTRRTRRPSAVVVVVVVGTVLDTAEDDVVGVIKDSVVGGVESKGVAVVCA